LTKNDPPGSNREKTIPFGYLARKGGSIYNVSTTTDIRFLSSVSSRVKHHENAER
jgi:hypothetical protein